MTMRSHLSGLSSYFSVLCMWGVLLVASAVATANVVQSSALQADDGSGGVFYAMHDAAGMPAALHRSVSIDMERVALVRVLQEIAQQADFGLAYSPDLVPEHALVSVRVDQGSVAEALRAVLENTDLRVVITARNEIVLVKAPSTEEMQATPLRASDVSTRDPSDTEQAVGAEEVRKTRHVVESRLLDNRQETGAITGTVTDSTTGQTIPGVNVRLLGTLQGAATNSDGHFTILGVEPGTYTLQASFVGYARKRVEGISVAAGDTTIVDIALGESELGLGELVVVGYGTQRRANVTGSVTEVDPSALATVSVPNASDLLAGNAAGVLTKQTQGVPGANHRTLSIRGFGSPLILVDGMEMSLDAIDPEDIESITVLKDASAAIYGSRAGNGVILVQTKRGEMGKPTIRFSSQLSAQTPTYWPEHVNAAEYAEMRREGQLYMGVEPTFTEEDVQSYKSGGPGYESYDWYDAVFNQWSPMQDHNMSVSGGSDEVRYFMSGGYKDEMGAFTSGDLSFKQYNARANVDAFITGNLTASADFAFRRELRNRPGRDIRGVFVDLNRVQPFYRPTLPDSVRGAPFSGYSNATPVGTSDADMSGFVKDQWSFLDGAAALEYAVPGVTGLSAKGELGYRYNWRFIKDFNRTFEVYEYLEEEDAYMQTAIGGADQISESNRQFWELKPLVSLRYERQLGSHDIEGLALAEWIVTEQENWAASRQYMLSNQIPYLFGGTLENVQNNGFASEGGRASFVSRLRYGFRDTYRLEGTLRADATHRFPESSRWGIFPSISAAWLIAQEPFMRSVDALDQLKLRLSYSQSGNDNVGAFGYIAGFNLRNWVAVMGGTPRRLITESGLPNPNITWLEMTIYNAGVDATLWNGMLSASADIFYRKTDNIFGAPEGSYPSSYGASLPQLNINATDDRGFELMLGHKNRVNDKFRYSVSGNLVVSKEKYVDWSEPAYDEEAERRVYQNEGNWVNRRVGYVSQGMFESQSEIDNWGIDQDGAENATLRPGDIKYKDLDGDGVLTWRDQERIGYGAFPDMSYGLNLSMTYGDVTARALFQGASMFTMNFNDIARMPFYNESTPFAYQYKHRWQPDDPTSDNPVNVNEDAKIPYIDGTGGGWSENNTRYSDFWLRDGTYLRLKTLSIAYALPGSITSPLGLQGLSVYVSGNNLHTWDRLGIFSGSFDPESPSTQNGRQYPPVSTYTFGINVSI